MLVKVSRTYQGIVFSGTQRWLNINWELSLLSITDRKVAHYNKYYSQCQFPMFSTILIEGIGRYLLRFVDRPTCIHNRGLVVIVINFRWCRPQNVYNNAHIFGYETGSEQKAFRWYPQVADVVFWPKSHVFYHF